VSNIRILLSDISPRVRSAVDRAVAGQADLRVVGETHGTVELLLHGEQADVVVLQIEGTELPAPAGVLVDEYPAIGVVGIDEAARRGLVYRTRPETHRVEPITGARLAEALRAAAAGSVWGVEPPPEEPAPGGSDMKQPGRTTR
jgi:DNA-binding NarL/FixJ family response regulator